MAKQVAKNTDAAPFPRLSMRTSRRRKDFATGTADSVLAGRVLIDWSGNLLSSHHMKLTVVAQGNDLVGFVGMDYRQDRMGAPMHPPFHPRTRDDPPTPTHEVGVRVTGAAATSALATFDTRWTEAATLSEATYDVREGERQYNPPPLGLS